jgi:hypothetical protein
MSGAKASDLGTGAAARGARGTKRKEKKNDLQLLKTKQALGQKLTDAQKAILRRAAQSTDSSQ